MRTPSKRHILLDRLRFVCISKREKRKQERTGQERKKEGEAIVDATKRSSDNGATSTCSEPDLSARDCRALFAGDDFI
jgi:hypothetical protein